MANWFQRRVFRQQEVLYDAVISEIRLRHPDTFNEFLKNQMKSSGGGGSSSSSSQNKTPFVHSHHILSPPWESIESLQDHFSENAPQSKSKQKYLKVVELLCGHSTLEEHRFDMNTIIQQLIIKIINSFNSANRAAECVKAPISSHTETNLLWANILASSGLQKVGEINTNSTAFRGPVRRRITPTSITTPPSRPTSPRVKHKLVDTSSSAALEVEPELKPKSPKLMRKTIDLDAIISQGRFDNFSNHRAAGGRVWGIEYFAALNAIPFVPVADLQVAQTLVEHSYVPPLKSPRTTCSSDSGSTRSASPPTHYNHSAVRVNPFPPRTVAMSSVFNVPFIALPVQQEPDFEIEQNTQYNARSGLTPRFSHQTLTHNDKHDCVSAIHSVKFPSQNITNITNNTLLDVTLRCDEEEDTESTMSGVSITSTEIKIECYTTNHSEGDPILNIALISELFENSLDSSSHSSALLSSLQDNTTINNTNSRNVVCSSQFNNYSSNNTNNNNNDDNYRSSSHSIGQNTTVSKDPEFFAVLSSIIDETFL